MKMWQKLKDASYNDIEDLNNKLGYKIPDSYKEFLISCAGGQPLNNIFILKDNNSSLIYEFEINSLFGIDDNLSCDLYHNKVILSDRISQDLLPIGRDGIGNIICIGISKEKYDNIYIWWSDCEKVELLTNSFNEFTNSLFAQN